MLKIEGSETTDLLNRIFTLNVQLLEPGEGDWTFLLNHKGRIQHVFWLVKESSACYYAICEHDISGLLDAIDMFIFSEDVHLSLSDLRCIYRWGAPLDELLNEPLSTRFDVPCFGLDGEQLLLIDAVQASHFIEQLTQRGSATQTLAQVESIRIMRGGSAPRDYAGNITPLDVSMRGVSEGKGCYPGQETIERTIALGRPARITLPAVIEGNSDHLELLDVTYQNGEVIEVYLRDIPADKPKVVGLVTSLASYHTSGANHQRRHVIVRVKQSAKDKELCVWMNQSSLDVILTVT
jgi:folate-binding Fe-S cluster repair protein YgfZ